MFTARAVLLTNNSIAAVLSVFLNCLLIYLINKRTTQQLKAFSRLMIVHCCSDVVLILDYLTAGAVSFSGVNGKFVGIVGELGRLSVGHRDIVLDPKIKIWIFKLVFRNKGGDK
jgi:hypothetical protein